MYENIILSKIFKRMYIMNNYQPAENTPPAKNF